MPVWHASVSVWAPDGLQRRDLPAIAEREGIKLLAGVGNTCEWWAFNPVALIGHVRVGLTDAENTAIDACAFGPVVADAGDAGPLRARTAWRG